MEKNQQFQVKITDYSSEGLGIGKTENIKRHTLCRLMTDTLHTLKLVY